MINKNSETQLILKKKCYKYNHLFYIKGIYFSEEKQRYIKLNNPRRLKHIKKSASKKFRRYKDYDMQFFNSSVYKKTYDVMWECW